ncbi:MAG: nuclear transport factor 2 family protein [Chloroflexi bacterium]|nr:nuclear transport factor 2 family protein [Chloroflexota bacterium]
MAQKQATVADLQKRVEALESELSVLRTIHRYSRAFDYGLKDEWSDVFAEDGELEVFDQGQRVRHEQGRKALARLLSERAKPPVRYDKHIQTMPLVTVTGDTASSETYLLRVTNSKSGPYIGTMGSYVDRLVKQDGTWRIKRRRIYPECRGAELFST